MKQKLASFALLLPLLLAVSCGNKQQGPVTLNKEGMPELNSVLDTLSWAYGQNIADVLMNQPVFDSLDAAVVLQSAQHAIAGGKQPLTVEEAKAALNYLLAMHNAAVQQQVEAQEQTVSQQQQKIMDEAMKSNPKLKKHPSGFLYECLKEGKGPKVQYAQRIRFDYKSFLMLTGEPYDQTYGKRDPIVHVVGEPMFPGLIEAFQLMNAGSIYRFYFPYQVAFGAQGSGNIPGYTPLIYEVEVHELYPD